MALFAEVSGENRVLRVIVADDIEWPLTRLGGTWVETTTEDAQQYYAGVGMGFDAQSLAQFAPDWVQPLGSDDAYELGTYTFYDGLVWQSVVPDNVWIPGIFGWRDRTNQIPKWFQPGGAGDAWPIGAEVTHLGQMWVATVDVNVWEPGVFGWDVVPPESPPGQSGWTDSGVTVTQVGGANLLYVSNTVPLPVGSLIRVRGIEATVTSVFSAGAPGLLVINPDIRAQAGDIVELWVENLLSSEGDGLMDSLGNKLGAPGNA